MQKTHTLRLTRHHISEGALSFIDSEGLKAFSARKLAATVGCEAMSLYHHFRDMDDILDSVVDLLFTEIRLPDTQPPDPRTALLDLGVQYLDMSERHAEAFVLVATRRWHTPEPLAFAAKIVELIGSLDPISGQALAQARMLGAYLNGAGLALAGWRHHNPQADRAAAQDFPQYSRALSVEAVRTDLIAGFRRLVETIGSPIQQACQ